jgi:hypothetical protein
MSKKFLLIACLVCALLLAACGGTENSNTTTTANSSNAGTTTSTTTTTTSNTAAANTSTAKTSSGEKIGVPDCDAFIAKYETCILNKVPEAQRAQYKSNIEQWRSTWRLAAAASKETVASLCKTTAEQAEKSMKSFGCDF